MAPFGSFMVPSILPRSVWANRTQAAAIRGNTHLRMFMFFSSSPSKTLRQARPIAERRLWIEYSLLLDLQATSSRLLFNSCSPFKVFQNKLLRLYGNRRLMVFPTARASDKEESSRAALVIR